VPPPYDASLAHTPDIRRLNAALPTVSCDSLCLCSSQCSYPTPRLILMARPTSRTTYRYHCPSFTVRLRTYSAHDARMCIGNGFWSLSQNVLRQCEDSGRPPLRPLTHCVGSNSKRPASRAFVLVQLFKLIGFHFPPSIVSCLAGFAR